MWIFQVSWWTGKPRPQNTNKIALTGVVRCWWQLFIKHWNWKPLYHLHVNCWNLQIELHSMILLHITYWICVFPLHFMVFLMQLLEGAFWIHIPSLFSQVSPSVSHPHNQTMRTGTLWIEYQFPMTLCNMHFMNASSGSLMRNLQGRMV